MVLDSAKYPMLTRFTKKIQPPERRTLGRQEEIKTIRANLMRPEVSNVILLGPAGSGKTAIVNELVRTDPTRDYYEVDLSLMSAAEGNTDGSVEMAGRMKRLVNEVEVYQHEVKRELVLFMDEFHLIAQVSKAALQAIKPLLAESGTRGIRIIAATTYEEFVEFIQGDEALTERLQRVSVGAPSRKTTIDILKNMKVINAPDDMVSDDVYSTIVDTTDKYMPAQSQPRKSILLFDSMLGWHRAYGDPLDLALMGKMLYKTNQINVSWRVDVEGLEQYLNNRVLDQKPAAHALAKRLYMSVAGLVDDTRPQGSFLFTGSTGVGKTEMAKALTKALFGSENRMIRFDMSEYAMASSIDVLRDRLTAEVWEHPFSTILFDEIEKANEVNTKLLLQVLDDARLTDRHGREVSFANSYIIMTTNAASEIYKSVSGFMDRENSEKADDLLAEYTKLIRKSLTDNRHFPTELINRLDGFVPFKAIGEETARKIAMIRLAELRDDVLTKHGVELHFSKRVLDYLVQEHADLSTDGGGGRGIKRRIDDEITSAIAQLLVMTHGVTDIAINVGGKFAFENKHDRIGTAHIVVSQWKPNRLSRKDRIRQETLAKRQASRLSAVS